MSSASKQKRLAKKAAKNGTVNTPKPGSSSVPPAVDELSLGSLKISSDRTANGVLTSQPMSKDIKIEQYSLSFFGRVLVDNATIEMNFGRR